MSVIEQILEDPFFSTRYKAILKLPLTNSNLYSTICKILFKINSSGELHLKEFELWFNSNYSSRKNYCYHSWKTLERANLVRKTKNNSLVLTIDGFECLKQVDEEKRKILIAKNITDTYIGVLEFLFLCLECENGLKTTEFFNYWFEKFEKTFETNRSFLSSRHQFSIIKKYLEDLSIINIENRIIKPEVRLINKIFDYYN